MADAPGTFRPIDDPQAEVDRLARDRQIAGGQICAEEDRRDGCPMRNVRPRLRAHDPDHCDRAWAAAAEWLEDPQCSPGPMNSAWSAHE